MTRMFLATTATEQTLAATECYARLLYLNDVRDRAALAVFRAMLGDLRDRGVPHDGLGEHTILMLHRLGGEPEPGYDPQEIARGVAQHEAYLAECGSLSGLTPQPVDTKVIYPPWEGDDFPFTPDECEAMVRGFGVKPRAGITHAQFDKLPGRWEDFDGYAVLRQV